MVKLSNKHQKTVDHLYLSALILASIGLANMLASAAIPGASAISSGKSIVASVLGMTGKTLNPGEISNSVKSLQMANFILNICLPISVLLLAVAIGLQNGAWDFEKDN